MAELYLDEHQKEEQLAKGILGLLSPAVEQVDEKIGEVRWVMTHVHTHNDTNTHIEREKAK